MAGWETFTRRSKYLIPLAGKLLQASRHVLELGITRRGQAARHSFIDQELLEKNIFFLKHHHLPHHDANRWYRILIHNANTLLSSTSSLADQDVTLRRHSGQDQYHNRLYELWCSKEG